MNGGPQRGADAPGEARLIEAAEAIGIALPDDQLAGTVAGARRLHDAARLIEAFLADLPGEGEKAPCD